MNGWLLAGLIAVGVVVLVVRRLTGEPLTLRDLCGPAIVLTALGAWTLWEVDGLGAADLAWVAGGALLGCALGAVRGATVRVYRRDGVLWQRYTGRTFLVIAGSAVLMAGFGLLASRCGLPEAARPVQLSIGVGFLGEAAVVGLRALATGVPFAPEGRR